MLLAVGKHITKQMAWEHIATDKLFFFITLRFFVFEVQLEDLGVEEKQHRHGFLAELRSKRQEERLVRLVRIITRIIVAIQIGH